MSWVLLAVAVVSGTSATVFLKVAARGRPAFYLAVVGGYLAAFTFLSLALADGLELGVAYGVWAASGIALTAGISRLVFDEPITRTTVVGMCFVIAGVLFIDIAGV